MPNTNTKKGCRMATSPVKHRPAIEKLVDSMEKLADSAARKMTPEELRKARREINEVIDSAVAARPKRRRQTA